MEPEEELVTVAQAMAIAKKAQLVDEVVLTAMKTLQANAALSIQECFEIALGEWDI